MKKFCSFSQVNLVFQSHLLRCKNLFFRLLYPIQTQRNEMELFMHTFLKGYKVQETKGKRSIAGGLLKFGKLLLNAANSVKPSVLQGVVETVNRNSLSLLENFNNMVQTSGLTSRVIKAQPDMEKDQFFPRRRFVNN